MFEELEEKSPTVEKKYLLLYTIGSLVLIILTLISVSLDEWYTYCYWNFGLIKASTFIEGSAFRNEQVIADVRADACYGLKYTIELDCPNFCDYPYRFEFGGAFILLSTIIALIVQIFTFFHHLVKLRRPDFKQSNIAILMIVIFLLDFIGFIGYYFISGFVDLKSVDNVQDPDEGVLTQTSSNDPVNFEWKTGMPMYLVLIILQFFLMIFGIIFTRKGFS
jgi:hypothetical protein